MSRQTSIPVKSVSLTTPQLQLHCGSPVGPPSDLRLPPIPERPLPLSVPLPFSFRKTASAPSSRHPRHWRRSHLDSDLSHRLAAHDRDRSTTRRTPDLPDRLQSRRDASDLARVVRALWEGRMLGSSAVGGARSAEAGRPGVEELDRGRVAANAPSYATASADRQPFRPHSGFAEQQHFRRRPRRRLYPTSVRSGRGMGRWRLARSLGPAGL